MEGHAHFPKTCIQKPWQTCSLQDKVREERNIVQLGVLFFRFIWVKENSLERFCAMFFKHSSFEQRVNECFPVPVADKVIMQYAASRAIHEYWHSEV